MGQPRPLLLQDILLACFTMVVGCRRFYLWIQTANFFARTHFVLLFRLSLPSWCVAVCDDHPQQLLPEQR